MKIVPVGKVTHYYDKIGVCIVQLSDILKVGDKIKISGHDKEFIQTITSLQVDYKQIPEAKKGEIVGIKVEKEVKAGDTLFLEQ